MIIDVLPNMSGGGCRSVTVLFMYKVGFWKDVSCEIVVSLGRSSRLGAVLVLGYVELGSSKFHSREAAVIYS